MALTDEQKKKIIDLHSTNEYSVAELSLMFKVKPTIIYRIVDPKYYENSKKQSREYSQKNREKLQKKEAVTYTRYYLKFHNKNDRDIIDRFAAMENVQGYIKSLVRADIANDGEGIQKNSVQGTIKSVGHTEDDPQKKKVPIQVRYTLKFHNENDGDIIDRFAVTGNVQGYIKSLVRADILSSSEDVE